MFKLPDLKFSYNDFGDNLDAKTMGIHYSKHHQAYVDEINDTITKFEIESPASVEDLSRNLDTLPKESHQAIINFGGGHFNHSFFWEILSSKKQEPSDKILESLISEFKSFDKFKEEFTDKALTLFESGWVFLSKDSSGKLFIKQFANQDSPIVRSKDRPLLTIDLWEHAYYLKYQNRRAEYITNWWNCINWEEVENKYFDN